MSVEAGGTLLLHDYWRSTASYRVRIALNLKAVPYARQTHDLRSGAQREAAYAALNPQQLVPALESEEGTWTQSAAILEWLEERFPTPPLLPAQRAARAVVRAMVQIVCCDIHPLHNLRVLNALRHDFGADEAAVEAWIGRWIGDGLAALEVMIARHGGRFACGDMPSLADCCLLPQVYAAERFHVRLDAYPCLQAVVGAARSIDAFARAHPDRQPDAPAPAAR